MILYANNYNKKFSNNNSKIILFSFWKPSNSSNANNYRNRTTGILFLFYALLVMTHKGSPQTQKKVWRWDFVPTSFPPPYPTLPLPKCEKTFADRTFLCLHLSNVKVKSLNQTCALNCLAEIKTDAFLFNFCQKPWSISLQEFFHSPGLFFLKRKCFVNLYTFVLFDFFTLFQAAILDGINFVILI